MSILEIKNLSHLFDHKPLFEDASLSINNGEHVGVVGLNGAGKSTFVNILAGKLIQDSGEVKWNNNIRKGYLDQHAQIEKDQTIMEYLQGSFAHLFEKNVQMEKMYAAMEIAIGNELEKLITKSSTILEYLTNEGFYDIEPSIKKVANGLGVGSLGYEKMMSNLSGGQRAKVMLAKLLLENPDMMLLDEPTNFLDIEHVDWLVDFLAGYQGTFLVISHDTAFLDKVCKVIISIENGQIKKYFGNYSEYKEQADQNAKQYEHSYHRQQEQIEKMKDYIARNSARAATAGMANSRKKMLDKIDILRKPTTIYDAKFSFPYLALHTKELLNLKNLQIGYDGVSLLPPINLILNSASKIWIRGTNGIGKTTLIKTLIGDLPLINGEIFWHKAAIKGYLEQDIDFGKMHNMHAAAYMSDRFPKINSKDLRSILANVGIKNDLATKPVSDLSGGEQVRVRLCALMQKNSNVLLLDEPTNHLDTRAKDALMSALIDYPGSIILVSHEKDFAEKICNEVFDAR
ncbi:MAG: ATP-binding cassette domain-containing protein [Firmicutes bacterium]|nr:ATP-binding cassette domain-containing protein [Bacillota bacterium]